MRGKWSVIDLCLTMLYCSGASSENAKTMNTMLFMLRSGMRLRFSPKVGHWLTHILILPRSPLWARFSYASNLTIHLTRPTVPSCIVEIMFLCCSTVACLLCLHSHPIGFWMGGSEVPDPVSARGEISDV